MNVSQCYLLTNDSDEEDKEQFHIREGYAEKDVTLQLGGFNAKQEQPTQDKMK